MLKIGPATEIKGSRQRMQQMWRDTFTAKSDDGSFFVVWPRPDNWLLRCRKKLLIAERALSWTLAFWAMIFLPPLEPALQERYADGHSCSPAEKK